MVTTCPCGQPGSFPPCVSLEVLTTPNRRYHGRMSFAVPPPACATPRSKRVFAHTQDHCFVVFKDVQLRFALRSMRIRRNLVCTRQMLNISVCLFFLVLGVLLEQDVVLPSERNTSITTSHISKAGEPSIRSPASNDMISDSVELWDTDACFLHVQQFGTKCSTPEVDF